MPRAVAVVVAEAVDVDVVVRVVDLILNEIVSPLLTLIDVAKPWIVVVAFVVTSQSGGRLPGSVFSHATWLVTGGVQGAAMRRGRRAQPREQPAQHEADDQKSTRPRSGAARR